MADDQKSTPGGLPNLMQDFIGQLRGVAERLEDLTGLGQAIGSMPALPSLPGPRTWPAPGAFSASQLKSIATSITAQRRSIEALRTQLAAFDEQLAVLESLIEPLAEWSKTWADLEERLTRLGRGPATEDPGSSS
jgi:hypothetical protein